MHHTLCERFGFHTDAIEERLRLLDLVDSESARLASITHSSVIKPNIDLIVAGFYASMGQNEQFGLIVGKYSTIDKLKETQRRYLLQLGQGFSRPDYFEERLRVGLAHQKVGVTLSIYQCAFRKLESLIIDFIPPHICADRREHDALIAFILKITALDMSLAIETYYADKVSSLERSLDDVREEGDNLRRQVKTDSLTGLCNRYCATEALVQSLAIAQENQQHLCIILADLDYFKQVNDMHGHIAGDKALKICATRIHGAARHTDVVARFGGEEFLLILRNAKLADAAVIAERVRQNVEMEPIHLQDCTVQVTLSLGVAEARRGDNTETLIARADKAMYLAKGDGRNCVRTQKDNKRAPIAVLR